MKERNRGKVCEKSYFCYQYYVQRVIFTLRAPRPQQLVKERKHIANKAKYLSKINYMCIQLKIQFFSLGSLILTFFEVSMPNKLFAPPPKKKFLVTGLDVLIET